MIDFDTFMPLLQILALIGGVILLIKVLAMSPSHGSADPEDDIFDINSDDPGGWRKYWNQSHLSLADSNIPGNIYHDPFPARDD